MSLLSAKNFSIDPFAAPSLVRAEPKGVVFALRRYKEDLEAHPRAANASVVETDRPSQGAKLTPDNDQSSKQPMQNTDILGMDEKSKANQNGDTALYVPPPRERDGGQPFIQRKLSQGELAYLGVIVDIHCFEKGVWTLTPQFKDHKSENDEDDDDNIKPIRADDRQASSLTYRHGPYNQGISMSTAKSIENAAGSMFVLDGSDRPSRISGVSQHPRPNDLPGLSKQVTIGRNSQFYDLTEEDEEKLGGIEYLALKMLLKIVIGMSPAMTTDLILMTCSG